jgi:hypothetical protein
MKRTLREELEQNNQPKYTGGNHYTIGNVTYMRNSNVSLWDSNGNIDRARERELALQRQQQEQLLQDSLKKSEIIEKLLSEKESVKKAEKANIGIDAEQFSPEEQKAIQNINNIQDDPELKKGLLDNFNLDLSPIKFDERSNHSSERQKDLDYIKYVLEQHSKKFEALDNKLGKSFDQDNEKLKDYYKAFINQCDTIFTSAKALLGGQLKIDGTKSIKIKATAQITKLIPLIGGNLSDGIQSGADYKAGVEEERKCKYIGNFGVTNAYMERVSKYIANSITSNENMSVLIEEYQPLDDQALVSKISKFANKLKVKFDNKLQDFKNNELNAQELLGQQHATLLINEYICSGKFRDMDKYTMLNEIIDLFIDSNLSEENEIEDNQQEPDQIYSGSSLVDQKDDGEITPKSKQIKEMQEQIAMMQAMFQAQLEEANKLNVEKDNRIKELEEESKNYMDDEEIIQAINSNKQIINDLQQETLEKDRLIDDKDDIIQKQADENGYLSNKLTTANDTIQELKVEKLAKDKRIDKLETRNEKLEVNNDIKDDKIKKLMDELHEERTKNLKNVSDTNSNKTIMERYPDTISPNNILPEQHEEAKIGGDFEDFNVDLQ